MRSSLRILALVLTPRCRHASRSWMMILVEYWSFTVIGLFFYTKVFRCSPRRHHSDQLEFLASFYSTPHIQNQSPPPPKNLFPNKTHLPTS